MWPVIKFPQRATIRRYLLGALVGLLTAAVALGVAELAAALISANSAPIIAVGETAINLTPTPLKEFAIVHFGSHDKEALLSGIVVFLIGFAALIGAVAVRRLAYGLAGLVVFAGIGVTAVLRLPTGTAVDVIPTLGGVLVGAVTMVLLVQSLRAAYPAAPARPVEASPATAITGFPAGPDYQIGPADPQLPGSQLPGSQLPGSQPFGSQPDRRRFLITGAGAAALAAVTGVAGDKLLGRLSVASARDQVRLPAAAVRARAVPAGTELRIPGLTPFFTPNASFYRVDTDLVLPQISPENWTLRIDGMVDHPLEISFAELLKMPLTEADITLVCVSNQVGGTYNGNARWLGAPLAGLLRKAGVKAGADQVLSTSTDGMTISTPVARIMDGRQALLAVGMNGQPLPIAHGFPARMIVPGLFGYVSATKWVSKLTLTTFAQQKAYWTQRGYSAQAPIKTESRIDVPKPLSKVAAGRVAVAGVAWAPATGIGRVEVSVDNGSWQQATLAAADGIDTWRQWMWTWDAQPGLHTLQVRATDSSGATQTSQRAGPVPNGSSGWDSTVVTVT
jgi:DMSO/TMAO reductase YedYZ molybdopterin-dependent catalytic subunit